ncbi:helix-turn-helix domain-containing protein [Oceanospirillum sediminis]|uniref:Helix-turn-helix domain-containing protein n=1 Tax=Oceanospirillum sediminis TaxID=2760088 RepID=A0A839IWX1_9GAMM|nr:helix-turn-helix domain-containing protein [Oceanospirillum sediminis]MBB1489190.1 helix-turn-helix domain-containing protein [Oceanospirillum sediminis]
MTDIKSLPSPNNPEEALAAAVALRYMADKLERKAVKEAITQGWSWSQVAEALGVSKQAAHKRHAASIQNTIGSKRKK